MTIVVVKNGAEKVVGTVTYQVLQKGQNVRMVVVRVIKTRCRRDNTTINLGDYYKLYFKMEVKNDGCDIGYKYHQDLCGPHRIALRTKYNFQRAELQPDIANR